MQFDIHKSLTDNVTILNLAPFIIDCQLCHFGGIKYILWADRCPLNWNIIKIYRPIYV